MMFADPDRIDTHLIGEDSLIDEIADDLRGVQRLSIRAIGDVAEGVEAEFDRVLHRVSSQVVLVERARRSVRALMAVDGALFVTLWVAVARLILFSFWARAPCAACD